MKEEKPKSPDRPAQKNEAQSSSTPTRNVAAPTTGAQTIHNLRRAVLTERARVHVGIIRDSLDHLMDQPELSARIKKQALIAWLMIEHSSLPYHEPPEPIFSETLLDAVLDLLSGPLRDGGNSGGGGGGAAGAVDTETTVLPQPVGPEALAIPPTVDIPKLEEPPKEKTPRAKLRLVIDREMD